MTYVLVHGAGMGASCWDRLLPHLDGPSVAVDLPGRGVRADTDVATVSLADCADALEQDVLATGADDIVLVAHSFAGVVVPRVMERLRARLRHVVFLAAVVPEDGTAVIDQIDPTVRSAVEDSITDGVYHQHPDGVRFMLTNDMTPEQADWTVSLVVDDSGALLTEVVDLGGLATDVPRTYVRTTQDACYTPDLQARSAPRVGGGEAVLESGHMPMVTQPETLARLLAGLRTSS